MLVLLLIVVLSSAARVPGASADFTFREGLPNVMAVDAVAGATLSATFKADRAGATCNALVNLDVTVEVWLDPNESFTLLEAELLNSETCSVSVRAAIPIPVCAYHMVIRQNTSVANADVDVFINGNYTFSFSKNMSETSYLVGWVRQYATYPAMLSPEDILQNYLHGPPNSFPTLIESLVVMEDTPTELFASDFDGDTTSIYVQAEPLRGAFSDGGTFVDSYPIPLGRLFEKLVYEPPPEFSGTVAFSYRVFDGKDTTPRSGFVVGTITVVPTNDPPTALDRQFETFANQSALVSFNYTDPDSPCSEITLLNLPESGKFYRVDAPSMVNSTNSTNSTVSNSTDGRLVTAPGPIGGCSNVLLYVPDEVSSDTAADIQAEEVIFFVPNDFIANGTTGRVDIRVKNDLQALGATVNATTLEDTSIVLTLRGERFSGGAFVPWVQTPVTGNAELSLLTSPTDWIPDEDFPVLLSNGSIVFTPPANESGLFWFDFRIQAPESGYFSAHQRIFVVVEPVNDPAVLTVPDPSVVLEVAVLEYLTFSASITDMDSDDDTFRVTIVSAPCSLSVNSSALDSLAFTEGDGASDRRSYFTATPQLINLAFSQMTIIGTVAGQCVVNIEVLETVAPFNTVAGQVRINVFDPNPPDATTGLSVDFTGALKWIPIVATVCLCCCVFVYVALRACGKTGGHQDKVDAYTMNTVKYVRGGGSAESLEALLFEQDGALVNVLGECDASLDLAKALIFLFDQDADHEAMRLITSRVTTECLNLRSGYRLFHDSLAESLFQAYARMIGEQWLATIASPLVEELSADATEVFPERRTDYTDMMLVGGHPSVSESITRLLNDLQGFDQDFPADLASVCNVVAENYRVNGKWQEAVGHLVFTKFICEGLRDPLGFFLIETRFPRAAECHLCIVAETIQHAIEGTTFETHNPCSKLNAFIPTVKEGIDDFVQLVSYDFKGKKTKKIRVPQNGLELSRAKVRHTITMYKKKISKLAEGDFYETIMDAMEDNKKVSSDNDVETFPPPVDLDDVVVTTPCPNAQCSATLQPKWKSCPICLVRVTCAQCDTTLDQKWKVCPKCQAPV